MSPLSDYTPDEWANAASVQIDHAGEAAAEGRYGARDTHIARAQVYAQLATVRALQDLGAKLNDIYHAVSEGR